MKFEIPEIYSKSATIKVDYRILRELLRLPHSVEIVDVATGNDCLILRLTGDLPAEGELTVDYTYLHTTVVKFEGFRKP